MYTVSRRYSFAATATLTAILGLSHAPAARAVVDDSWVIRASDAVASSVGDVSRTSTSNESSDAAVNAAAMSDGTVDPEVIQALEGAKGGPVRVLVSVGRSRANAAAKAEAREAAGIGSNDAVAEPTFKQVGRQIRLAKQRMKSAAPSIDVVRDFEHTDLTFVELDSSAQLAELLRSGEAVRVFADAPVSKSATQSLSIIRKQTAPATSYNGAGTYVAVLDSGVDFTLPAFGACVAPGGSCAVSHAFDSAPTSDGVRDDDGHGTNVSAIALAVAPATKIIGVDVFRNTGGSGTSSDVVAGVNYVIGLKNSGVNVVAANLSLGLNNFTGGATDCPLNDNFGAASLIAAGISVVAAAGNEARTTGVGAPACVPGVIAVGATYDANVGGINWGNCSDATTAVDKIVCFSNSSNRLDALAPGAFITAAGITQGGTSQAAPHVAGAIALLAQAEPTLTVAARRVRVQNTGFPITDLRNGLTRNRLDLPHLLGGTAPGSTILVPGNPSPTNDNRSNAIALSIPGSSGGSNSFATREPGEATGRSGQTVWWTVTSPINQRVKISTCGSAFDRFNSFDTYLTVFQGATVVSENDDFACIPGLAGTLKSQVELDLVASQVYAIQVDGYSLGDTGDIVLRVTPTSGSGSVTISPSRLLDTRAGQPTIDGQAQGTGAIAAGTSYALQVTGRAGIAAGATAVTFNMTTVSPAGAGWITAYPCDQPRPQDVSALNYTTNAVVGNLATIKLSAGGQVCLYSVATTHLVVDVTGYIPAGGPFQAISPLRYLETRTGQPTFDGQAQAGGQIAAGGTRTLQITGRGPIPAGASSVTFNVTAITPSGPGWITAYPCDQPRPTDTSSLNYNGADIRGNLATIKLSPSGTICLYSQAASHVVVDVTGYQPTTTSYSALTPVRLLDTRPGLPTIDGLARGGGMLPAGSVGVLRVGGRGGVPAGAAAVTMNLTVVSSAAGGWITAFPCDVSRPLSSSLNFGASQVVGNLAHIKLASDGTLCLYAESTTHLIVDVTGYDN
jgi:hypothetical protein